MKPTDPSGGVDLGLGSIAADVRYPPRLRSLVTTLRRTRERLLFELDARLVLFSERVDLTDQICEEPQCCGDLPAARVVNVEPSSHRGPFGQHHL